jgi:hypothetical protein
VGLREAWPSSLPLLLRFTACHSNVRTLRVVAVIIVLVLGATAR